MLAIGRSGGNEGCAWYIAGQTALDRSIAACHGELLVEPYIRDLLPVWRKHRRGIATERRVDGVEAGAVQIEAVEGIIALDVRDEADPLSIW